MENIDSLKIARKLLKSKREELSLSIEDICRELKLDKKIIKNIFKVTYIKDVLYL